MHCPFHFTAAPSERSGRTDQRGERGDSITREPGYIVESLAVLHGLMAT